MKFIVIFGPPAVGKMTVGYELAKLTSFKLFHNHMTIDLVSNFFEHGSPQFKLNTEFRYRIFEEFSQSNHDGLIFTFVWGLDSKRDKAFVDKSCAIFSKQGVEIYFVELYAGLAERLKRNKTQFRLSQKRPKRDIDRSEELLLKHERQFKMNSDNNFFYPEKHLKLDNTKLLPQDVADKINTYFNLI